MVVYSCVCRTYIARASRAHISQGWFQGPQQPPSYPPCGVFNLSRGCCCPRFPTALGAIRGASLVAIGDSTRGDSIPSDGQNDCGLPGEPGVLPKRNSSRPWLPRVLLGRHPIFRGEETRALGGITRGMFSSGGPFLRLSQRSGRCCRVVTMARHMG